MTCQDIEILAPTSRTASLDELLSESRAGVVEPFAPERIELLDAFSKALLSHPTLRRDAGAVALGFWLRQANLAALEKDFRATGRAAWSVPAGLALHITPANVDTMFAYSWALAYLTGNANIVRLTTRASAFTNDLLGCVRETMAKHAAAVRGNWFVSYPREADEITERFSLACDVRIVWGGDETVRRIRAIPLNPHAGERSFASKRSFSIIGIDAYLSLPEKEREQLADRMAGDVAPFGQMACSSPQEVFWIGDIARSLDSIMDFHERLERAMARKQGAADFGLAVRRLNFAFDAAATGAARVLHAAHTTQVWNGSESGFGQTACGAGLLHHRCISSLDVLVSELEPDRQTVSYFGLPAKERDLFAVAAAKRGVDRVVPIGRALDFSPQWDGFNLWHDLTRGVTVL